MTNPKGFYAEFYGAKKKVIFLQPYFLQGGRWHKLKASRKAAKKVR